jgi:hypothetical protein
LSTERGYNVKFGYHSCIQANILFEKKKFGLRSKLLSIEKLEIYYTKAY